MPIWNKFIGSVHSPTHKAARWVVSPLWIRLTSFLCRKVNERKFYWKRDEYIHCNLRTKSHFWVNNVVGVWGFEWYWFNPTKNNCQRSLFIDFYYLRLNYRFSTRVQQVPNYLDLMVFRVFVWPFLLIASTTISNSNLDFILSAFSFHVLNEFHWNSASLKFIISITISKLWTCTKYFSLIWTLLYFSSLKWYISKFI